MSSALNIRAVGSTYQKIRRHIPVAFKEEHVEIYLHVF
jgi:hypothetical protein